MVSKSLQKLFSMRISILIIVFLIFFSLELCPSKAQTWIRAGYYWDEQVDAFSFSNINSSPYTHLICAFAGVNSTTYQLSFASSSEETVFASFTDTVKQKNPSVTTLLSIGGKSISRSTFSSLVSNESHRKSFIESSIKIARLYGFQGLDLWFFPNTSSDMFNMGILFREWRAAAILEARKSRQPQLLLTSVVKYSPHDFDSASNYPVESAQRYLNWVHVLTTDYKTPRTQANFTAAYAALYGPSGVANTDNGIKAWIDAGLSSNKLVFCLPFYGYAWNLLDPKVNGVGAPAAGPARDGIMTYMVIKSYIERNGANVTYNSTYAVKYCSIGTVWLCFDDVDVVRVKISYAKEKRLLGYFVWQVYMDNNWELSKAAAEYDKINVSSTALEDKKTGKSKWPMLVVTLTSTATVILLIGLLIYKFWRMRKLKSEGNVHSAKKSDDEVCNAVTAGDFNKNDPNLTVYNLADIEAATDKFSFVNKLGEGGFGPVYKGILPDGKEIAVKKLSKTSAQGFEEFNNEVMLTAKLQHVNLVKLLGYCIDKDDQMLIYEYMPNKSLGSYLFDPIKLHILDWKKRAHIIEDITQGLLYLQEYSRLTIIHRDLKASNILLDEDMRAKISDFGMARIFIKDDLEANTGRIVGTMGYVPPEFVQRGLYSTKSDVYSFGVLLLQIISGKRIALLYGQNESSSLLDYAYELWKDGKGMEFMDESLDDTHSSCKLMRCLQIALLCVQENPNDRPSMLEVFSMLKNETTEIRIPKKPAFTKYADKYGRNISSSQKLESGSVPSVNDVTISQVVAR